MWFTGGELLSFDEIFFSRCSIPDRHSNHPKNNARVFLVNLGFRYSKNVSARDGEKGQKNLSKINFRLHAVRYKKQSKDLSVI